jgi:hypothetical protein
VLVTIESSHYVQKAYSLGDAIYGAIQRHTDRCLAHQHEDRLDPAEMIVSARRIVHPRGIPFTEVRERYENGRPEIQDAPAH